MDPLVLIVVILLVLWAVGYVFIPVAGGLIHVLLVIVLVIVVIRLLRGERIL